MLNLESQTANRALNRLDKIYDAYIWPTASLILTLRPLHAWAMGNFAGIKEGNKVLEIGAGYGLYNLYSGKVGNNGLFVPVDIQPKIQERAKKIGYWFNHYFQGGRNNETAPVTANAVKLPFLDNSFDILLASNFSAPDDPRSETMRVLKPGGKAIFSWLGLLFEPFGARAIANALKEAEFTNVQIRLGVPAGLFGINWYIEALKPQALLAK